MLTHASIVCEGMLASVNSVKNSVNSVNSNHNLRNCAPSQHYVAVILEPYCRSQIPLSPKKIHKKIPSYRRQDDGGTDDGDGLASVPPSFITVRTVDVRNTGPAQYLNGNWQISYSHRLL